MARAASTARRTSSRSMSRGRAPSEMPPRLFTPRTWLPATPTMARLHRHAGDAFGFFERAADGADRRVQIDDQALARAFGFRGAHGQEFRAPPSSMSAIRAQVLVLPISSATR